MENVSEDEKKAVEVTTELNEASVGHEPEDLKQIHHKHMMVNAKVNNPIKTTEEAIEFLKNLVSRINMKIIQGPFASYVDVPGNRGLTAIVMIETSHIAFHIWDEQDPSMLQFDLYTCGWLIPYDVCKALEERFEVVSMDWVLYDRQNGFVLEDQNI